ncbi:glucoamylase family protein [Pirellulales bacterium]|nr:glucoamylase family protein [Pirellulales bacterium]
MTRSTCIIAALLAWQLTASPLAQSAERIDRLPSTEAALEYSFTPEDEQLLDEIQRGCFEFLWKEVGNPAPLVKDRLTNSLVSSLAGVGFQLSALPIGVERGWISREQGEERAAKILQALEDRDDNKKLGIYLHYVDLHTGGQHRDSHMQVQASTVDHALLQAGAMAAGVYFGGTVAELADRMTADANWKAYEVPLNENIRRNDSQQVEKFVSFGWRADDEQQGVKAPGSFRPWSWYKATAEEHLVTFLAVGSPVDAHAVEPDMYYRLHRLVKQHTDMPPFAVSWSGPAFTYFFAHCWIDFRQYGTDDPGAFGSNEMPIDWWENSRRAMLAHRARCLESTDKFKTFAEDRWGMSPGADLNADGSMGYIVQSIRPSMEDRDNFCGGTVTPYAAGSAIMFMPNEAVTALRAFRNLKDANGKYVVWRDLDEGGYGLLDSFNLDREEVQGTPDYLSIDDGPMILAIENARTGLIWRLFMEHPSAKLAVERLQWKPRKPAP